MIAYAAAWILAESLAVLMFILALRARVASIPVHKFRTWGVGYPILIAFAGWQVGTSVSAGGDPLAADFILPVFFAVISVVLILAVRAYARSNEV